jgi:hypothetical protein
MSKQLTSLNILGLYLHLGSAKGYYKFCLSLKTRALIDERNLDMNRSDKYNDRYVIPMHRKNVWANKWMQNPRKNFLQASYHDPSA